MYAWEQIQTALDYIDDNIDEQLEIGHLAKLAGLSPFYFQRLFTRLVKKPVMEYVKLRRLSRATDVLRDSDRRILDIALELGFSSHEHFSRVFKEAFGMTPDSYRKAPERFLNHTTKPELLLNYTLIDEDAPLVADGIVFEITRKQLTRPAYFAGLTEKVPTGFIDELGSEPGVNPLDALWRTVHERKSKIPNRSEDNEEIGVTHANPESGYFNYFAGIKTDTDDIPPGYLQWIIEPGEYIVCSVEAEDFKTLVTDALYKAEQYLFNVWLPGHNLSTEPFCAERYPDHADDLARLEIWLKPARQTGV